MPFQNPADYVQADGLLPGASLEHVTVSWLHDSPAEPCQSCQPVIYVQGQALATLSPGARPGWSVLARRDGPLALVWTHRSEQAQEVTRPA